jgi:hypothetical protein
MLLGIASLFWERQICFFAGILAYPFKLPWPCKYIKIFFLEGCVPIPPNHRAPKVPFGILLSRTTSALLKWLRHYGGFDALPDPNALSLNYTCKRRSRRAYEEMLRSFENFGLACMLHNLKHRYSECKK